MTDLSPVFIEPTGEHAWDCDVLNGDGAFCSPGCPREPKVAGITSAQWTLFRQIEEENRCDFDDDLNNRCPDAKAPGSNFCTFHERVEEYYDEYDIWRDYPYEVDE